LLDKKPSLTAPGKSRQNLEVSTGAQAAVAQLSAARNVLYAKMNGEPAAI
jgi:hypothetical protein